LGYGGLEATREALEALLTEYDGIISSSASDAQVKDQAKAIGDQIRERLVQGDFRAGDRIILQIAGETLQSDTVVVGPGSEIVVAGMGRIPLAGILRSELQGHLTREIGRYIHDPVVRTLSLMRLSIQGAVARPGFYVIPATALLGDVIMFAGGPSQSADLERLEIERNGQILLEGVELRAALTEGRSVDQLNLRAGDQVMVPNRPISSIWRDVAQYGLMLVSVVGLLVQVF
jgi:protein involved in polysaccharide export with SLBB domain